MQHRYLKRKKLVHEDLRKYTHEEIKSTPDLFFVYDRTQEDVDKAIELNNKYLNGTITKEEKEEWEKGIEFWHELRWDRSLKGVLNVVDIERVEWNTSVIADLLVIDVQTNEWHYGDIPRVTDYKRIRDNVDKLRSVWNLKTVPKTPIQPLNTYQKWNDIEKILHDIYSTYIGLLNNRQYCGTEMYAGESVGDL